MALILFEVSLTSALMIALVLLISKPLKKRYSVLWRYWAWLLIAIRLLLPIGASSFPSLPSLIPLPVLPSVSAPEDSEQSLPPQSVVSSTTSRPTGNNVAVSRPVQIKPQSSVESRPAQSLVDSAVSSKPVVSTPSSTPSISTPPSRQPIFQWTQTTSQIILLVWASGAIFCLTFHLTGGILFLRSLRHRKTGAIASETKALLLECCQELKLRRTITAVRCNLATPMAVGLLHPVILLPDSIALLPPEDLRMILLHELTHLKRRDMERKLLLLFAACIHWFNPLVWLMLRCSGQDMEATCDDAVLARCPADSKDRYCRLLLAVAGGSTPPTSESRK